MDNRRGVLAVLDGQANDQAAVWIIACLCAQWCDVCCASRDGFDRFAARHPDKQFVWVDIEDHADVVGDLDVENFPTLLIQHGNTVAFYGTIMPDWNQANRLLEAQLAKDADFLTQEASSTAERIRWQAENNLRHRLRESL